MTTLVSGLTFTTVLILVVVGAALGIGGIGVAILTIWRNQTDPTVFHLDRRAVAVSGTGLGFAVVGILAIFLAHHLSVGDEERDAVRQSSVAHPTSSSASQPGDPPTSTLPPAKSTRASLSFKTPRGIECATYVSESSDSMACVMIKGRDWGKTDPAPGCQLLYRLEAHGETELSTCPNEDELESVLFDYPSPPARRMKDDEYADRPGGGGRFDMGPVNCTVASSGTTCKNLDGKGFTISTKKHLIF